MEEKYERVLKYCEQELERILKLFRRQRDDPPMSRSFPPIAGDCLNTDSGLILIIYLIINNY